MKRVFFTSTLVLAILLKFWNPTGAQAPKPAAVVEMTSEFRFVPDVVKIKNGDTVQWKNVSEVVHTVTADPAHAANPKDAKLPKGAKAFSSGDIQPGHSFTHTFTVPGKYRYFCTPHEISGMLGEVDVSP